MTNTADAPKFHFFMRVPLNPKSAGFIVFEPMPQISIVR